MRTFERLDEPETTHAMLDESRSPSCVGPGPHLFTLATSLVSLALAGQCIGPERARLGSVINQRIQLQTSPMLRPAALLAPSKGANLSPVVDTHSIDGRAEQSNAGRNH